MSACVGDIYRPGAYEAETQFGKNAGATMKSRHPTKEDLLAPGPGAYQLGSTLGEAPGYTMRPKYAGAETERTPGPGQHTIQQMTAHITHKARG